MVNSSTLGTFSLFFSVWYSVRVFTTTWRTKGTGSAQPVHRTFWKTCDQGGERRQSDAVSLASEAASLLAWSQLLSVRFWVSETGTRRRPSTVRAAALRRAEGETQSSKRSAAFQLPQEFETHSSAATAAVLMSPDEEEVCSSNASSQVGSKS